MSKIKVQETWKKQDVRSQSQGRKLTKNERERARAERAHSQIVKVCCNKSLLLPPGLFKSFTVRTTIPLRYEEIMEKMQKAFPELKGET